MIPNRVPFLAGHGFRKPVLTLPSRSHPESPRYAMSSRCSRPSGEEGRQGDLGCLVGGFKAGSGPPAAKRSERGPLWSQRPRRQVPGAPLILVTLEEAGLRAGTKTVVSEDRRPQSPTGRCWLGLLRSRRSRPLLVAAPTRRSRQRRRVLGERVVEWAPSGGPGGCHLWSKPRSGRTVHTLRPAERRGQAALRRGLRRTAVFAARVILRSIGSAALNWS